MYIYVQKKRSKDGKKCYLVLLADLGYTIKLITYDINQIAEYCDVSVKNLLDHAEHVNDNDILYKSEFQMIEVI